MRTRWGAALWLLAPLCVAACGDTRSEQVTGPSNVRCQVSVTPPAAVPPAATGFSMPLTTPRECTWSIAVDGSWLTVEPLSGQGDATLSATAAANPQGRARAASLAVNDQRVVINQQPAPCRFSVTPTTIPMPAEGGRALVQITTLDGCTWSTRASQAWTRVVSGSSGEGSKTIELTVDSNTGDDRTGEVRVADLPVTVVQEALSESARGCPYSMGAGSANFPSSGGTGAVRLHTRPTCAWGASSSQPWVVILSHSNGVGTDDIDYRVEPNPTTRARTATITAAGRQHVVRQAAR
jgi:hypothetical protein